MNKVMERVAADKVITADQDIRSGSERADDLIGNAPYFPSAIEDVNAQAEDPFPALVAALLTDLKRPLSDFHGWLHPETCSKIEALMDARGSAETADDARWLAGLDALGGQAWTSGKSDMRFARRPHRPTAPSASSSQKGVDYTLSV